MYIPQIKKRNKHNDDVCIKITPSYLEKQNSKREYPIKKTFLVGILSIIILLTYILAISIFSNNCMIDCLDSDEVCTITYYDHTITITLNDYIVFVDKNNTEYNGISLNQNNSTQYKIKCHTYMNNIYSDKYDDVYFHNMCDQVCDIDMFLNYFLFFGYL
jgi:hypothetical protein